MKSLKRTLCLVLALVMVLGLFGIASATNFTDDDTIQYKEAVEVITGIGAIKGMGDGTFAPKGTITRAQAATMVARVALTVGVADNLAGVASNFTDVTVEGGFAWAIPSIEYLVREGIINGMGDGTFNPNGEISGYAVLKMLLCVLGYGKQDEYIGLGWDLKVAIDASRKDIALTKGRATNTSYNSPATREEVALYCYNALSVPTVNFDKDTDAYVPASKGTIGESVYGIDATPTNDIYGVVTANGATSSECAEKGLTMVGTDYYKINTNLDMVGHYVRVYADTSDSTTLDGSTADKAIPAYAVVDKSTVVTLNTADAAKVTDATTWEKAFGKNVDLASGIQKFKADYSASTATITKDSAAVAGTYLLGVDTDKATKIFGFIEPNTTGFEVAKVTSVSPAKGKAPGSVVLDGATKQTVVLPGSEDTVQVPHIGAILYNLYDGIAKDDIVTIATTGDFKTVVKATTEEGTVASTATDAKTSTVTFVAEGKTYTVAPAGLSAKISSLTLDNTTATTALGNKCTIYMGPDGKVIGLEKVAGASADAGLVYVVDGWVEEGKTGGTYGETETSTFTVMAQCVNMDGEIVNYPVGVAANKNANADPGAGKGLALTLANKGLKEVYKGHFVTVSTAYNANLKGDMATLKLVSADETTFGKTVNTANKAAGAALTTATVKLGTNDYLDSATKFIFVVTTGGKLSTTKTAVLTKDQTLAGATTNSSVIEYYSTKASATETNYTVKYAVVTGDSTLPNSTDGTGFVFVPKFDENNLTTYQATQADGSKKATPAVQTTVFIDGAPKTIITQADGQDADGATIATGFYTYKVDVDGLYTLDATTTGVGMGVVTNVYNGAVTTFTTSNPLSDVSLSTAKFNLDLPALTGSAAHGEIGIGDNIAYTFTTTDSVKTVTGVYYLGTVTVELSANSVTDDNKVSVNVTATPTSSVADDTFTYQWMKGASPVAGATAAKLDVTSFDAAASGTYFCVVTAASGLKGVSGNVNATTTDTQKMT